jgi:hypothetical protein
LTLAAIPGTVASFTGAQITIRANVSSTKSQSYFEATIYKSNGTTALCTAISGGAGNGDFEPSTSFSNLTVTCTGVDTTIADWTGAILSFGAEADGKANTLGVSEVSVTLTGVTLNSAPATPTGLAVASDATNPTTVLDVSWNSSAGATSYTLLQSSTKAGTFTAVQTGISGTSTTVTGLTPGTEYAFEIEAVGSGGTSAASSAVAWATEPGLPTSLGSPSQTGTSISLSFSFPVIGSNLSQTCQYRYETPPGAANWQTGNIGNGSTPITGLTPGTQYGIEIASVIQSTNSDWSGSIQGAWTSEITVVTPINAIPARCNVVMARVVHGWTVENF